MVTQSPDGKLSIDLLSSKQVARRLSVSVRTVWRLLRNGALPQPIRYTRKLVRWRTKDIDGFVASPAANFTEPGARGEPGL